ncbi:hypothetical protein QQ045_003619 [Rhodiola kirilowii]
MRKQGSLSLNINNKEACTPTSRLNSTLVKIDSISINIDAAEQSKSEGCEHFTIRGFVADNRERNRNQCWPFSGYDDARFEDINLRLHPLDVPKSRWWLCQSCLSEIDAEGASEDAENATVNSSRLLKTKSSRFHPSSLEDVVAHLSKKLKQPPGWAECKGTKSASEFVQKQIVDPAIDLNTGVRENEVPIAASDFISNQPVPGHSNNELITFTNVGEHQKQLLTPAATTSSKFGITDGAKLKGRHAAGMKLVHNHQNPDDSGGTGCRKTKTKKVRFLKELLDRDKKYAQPTGTGGGSPAIEAAKESCSASGNKKNKKYQKQDTGRSQLLPADSSCGKGEKRKAQDIKCAFADAEMHMTSKSEHSDAINKQAGKKLLGIKQGADRQNNYYDRGQKRIIDSCRRQVFQSTCLQAVHGRVTDPRHNSITPSFQIKGKSNDALDKTPQGVNIVAPADNSKELDGNRLPKKPVETDQIGQQSQSVEDEFSSKNQYLFSDGCLDTRKGTRYYVPRTGNGSFRNETAVQYMGESSSACKYLVDKNTWQGTNSNSGLKRPNRGPCVGNKKPKHSARTEGLNAVHPTEFLISNSNKVVGSRENSELPPHKLSNNMMQEVGTSDDIPMEIVELMARYQYERRVLEVGDNHHLPQSGSNTKHDVVESTSVLRAQQNKKSHLPSTYGPVLSSQQELLSVQSSALASSKPDLLRNCKYDMNNFSPGHRVSPSSRALYQAWQPASHQSDKIARSWPVITPNNPVHMPSAHQGSAPQLFDAGKVPTRSSYVGERRDLDSSNLAHIGQTINDFRPEASNASHPVRVDSRPQMTRSPNPYANETISAMHLLSLKDGDMQSSTPTNKETIANRKTFDRSFSNDHLAKELSGNNFGVGKSYLKFQQPPPYGYQSKVVSSDAPCKCSPPVPIFGSVVASLPGDVGNKKGIHPSNRHPESTHLNRNAGGSLLPSEKNGFLSQKSRLANTSSLPGQELVSAHELSKHIFSPLWSVAGSSHSFKNNNIIKHCNSKSSESYDNLKRRYEPGACCVNRNPMDFTTPGPGNEFMIGAEELKLRNRIHTSYITRPMATNALGGHRFTTYTTPNNWL